MAKYLVTFNDQYNDVELHGFKIMTDKEVESFEELASSITWSFIYPLNVGELEFSSGEDLLSRLEFKEISNDEYKVLSKTFDEEFGVFVTAEYLEEIISEEDDFSDDEEEDEDDEDFYNSKEDDDDDY
jgi:hypothetical protein